MTDQLNTDNPQTSTVPNGSDWRDGLQAIAGERANVTVVRRFFRFAFALAFVPPAVYFIVSYALRNHVPSNLFNALPSALTPTIIGGIAAVLVVNIITASFALIAVSEKPILPPRLTSSETSEITEATQHTKEEHREQRIDALLDFQRVQLNHLTKLRDAVDEKLYAARMRSRLAADRVAACRALVEARSMNVVFHYHLPFETECDSANVDLSVHDTSKKTGAKKERNDENESIIETATSNLKLADDTSHSSDTVPPIGVLYTTLQKRFEAPRQSFLGPAATGVLLLQPHVEVPPGISTGKRLLLLYWFDRNGKHWRTHVRPPRRVANAGRVGVLATRSPHRPTPIGLSYGAVVRVDGRRIYMRGLDVLDETPVISVRLYDEDDCFLKARDGWLTDTETIRPLHYDDANTIREVVVPKIPAEKLAMIAIDAERMVRDALARGHGCDGVLAVGAFRVKYETKEDKSIRVIDVVSGMRAEVCEAEAAVDPELAIHARFKARYEK